jgi:elongator complex protein 1
MRNLRIIQRSDVDLSDSSVPLTASSWESKDSILCTFGPSVTDPTIELCRINQKNARYESRQLIASWPAPCPSPDLESDQVINLQYFSDSQSCCIVLAGGDIILVRENFLPGEEHIEILGTVDDGIAAASWSPDEELLAIRTNTSSFILMSREFEPVADVTFSEEDFKASKHVSVGWGKVETQFKGKRAKALRDPTVPEHVDEGLPSPFDNGRSTVSWRGDGEYVAVNSKEDNGRRVIRVFSRDGSLDSVSEPVDYLEGALSWRPAGNLMAGIKRVADKAEVVFFERNGLRHGQFPLRLSESELREWGSIIGLNWNHDSTVLSVIFNDRIQFWTMGNYHYYLKQTILIPSSAKLGKQSIQIRWNAEVPLLFLSHHEGTINRGNSFLLLKIIRVEHLSICEFVFAVAKGSTTTPGDSGTIAVIDGSKRIDS